MVERLEPGTGWTALAEAEVAVGGRPQEGLGSTDAAGEFRVLTLAGWQRGRSYRVRLAPGLADGLGRVFGRAETLEWSIPTASEHVPTPAVAYDRRFPTAFDSWEAAADTAEGRFPAGQSRLFQGLWTDPVTGLGYARARWYDARNAAWLAEDPMDDVDSPNLYAFVAWMPSMGVDPRGLCSAWEIFTNQHDCRDYFVEGWNEGWEEDKEKVSLAVSVIPVVGDIKDVQEVVTGVDLVTGEELTTTQRVITLGAAFIPLVGGKALREGVEAAVEQGAKKGANDVLQAAAKAEREAVSDAAGHAAGQSGDLRRALPYSSGGGRSGGGAAAGSVQTRIAARGDKALELVPSRYRASVARSFRGEAVAETLAEDLVVYRRWGGKAPESGSPWFSPQPYVRPGNARRYLALPETNTAENLTAFRIPAGTMILRGKVASQAGEIGFAPNAVGGGVQIYIPDPSVAIPVR